MSLIDEVKEEITGGRTVAPQESKPSEPKRRRRRIDDMTDEEREAFLARKRQEEEARYLGDPGKKRRRRKPAEKETGKPVEGKAKTVRRKRRARSSEQSTAKAKPSQARPKMLQPLETLYLLRIPGLPKGDCLAICYARGADQ